PTDTFTPTSRTFNNLSANQGNQNFGVPTDLTGLSPYSFATPTNNVVAISGTPTQTGVFNFTVTATDGTNSYVTNYRLNIAGPNTPPTITGAANLSRQQGATATNSTIATVTDDSGNGNVGVTVTSANPSNGVTLSNI